MSSCRRGTAGGRWSIVDRQIDRQIGRQADRQIVGAIG